MVYIRFGSVSFGFFLLCLSLPVNSAVYKCKDQYGRISYSQYICPEDAEVNKIIKLRGGRATARDNNVDCGLVKNFAAEVGIAVNKRQSVDDFYAKYGGVEQLSPTALNIIRSVYQYQSQAYKTIQDSVQHENERCLSEAYGVPHCSQFPLQFITDNGGCAQAADANVRLQHMYADLSDEKLRSDNRKTNQRVASAADAAKARNENQAKTCQESLRMSLMHNQRKARQASSAAEQDELRAQRMQINRRLALCGK